MLSFLKRHPVPIQAFFDFSLVLTYAFPENLLKPLLAPGLTLDGYQGMGFVAIAFVQTRGLRPLGFPAFIGCDFFLSGYRVFCRYRRSSGQELRGLRILRSDTDNRLMKWLGNRLTHYNYQHCDVRCDVQPTALILEIHTPKREADIRLKAEWGGASIPLPPDSPFPDWTTARRYAGPLPFTFNYEADSHSLVLIEGVRKEWVPLPVRIDAESPTFFSQPPFTGVKPVLANAFIVQGIPYQWKQGVLEKLPKAVK
jgi:hypothetical protein